MAPGLWLQIDILCAAFGQHKGTEDWEIKTLVFTGAFEGQMFCKSIGFLH